MAPGALVLVDLFAADRVALDRPGQRLMRRLLRNPSTAHVRPVAWSAQAAPDVIEHVRAEGAAGFVIAARDRDQERADLRRALAAEEVWPPAGSAPGNAEAAWTAWFVERYGLAWEPWIEPVLVRLASVRERRAVLAELVDEGAAKSTGHAAARLRTVARAVAGEHRNSAAAVSAAASLALSHIAAHRPLTERPPIALSLEQSAEMVRTSPSLVRAAGLSEDEVDEIAVMDGLIAAKRLQTPVSAGAPAADLVRNERQWAAGRRALEQGAGRGEIDEVAAGILERLDDALAALADARDDGLYHPEARAAAALGLARAADVGSIDGAASDGGAVTWHGRNPTELCLASDEPAAGLQRLSSVVDALVRARNRPSL